MIELVTDHVCYIVCMSRALVEVTFVYVAHEIFKHTYIKTSRQFNYL